MQCKINDPNRYYRGDTIENNINQCKSLLEPIHSIQQELAKLGVRFRSKRGCNLGEARKERTVNGCQRETSIRNIFRNQGNKRRVSDLHCGNGILNEDTRNGVQLSFYKNRDSVVEHSHVEWMLKHP